MIEIPKNILEFFFKEIKLKGKYEIEIRKNIAYIIPKEKEKYYKPIIKIPDLASFAILLRQYIQVINEFNQKNNVKLQDYQDLSYIFNIMLFNMTTSDALNLNKYLETRISFFYDNNLEDFWNPQKVFEYNNITFYAQKELEDFGLETPYIMTFFMEINEKQYKLPIIRYAINNERVCFIYVV